MATKSKNTNVVIRLIAVILSVFLMLGSAFFVVRIVETGIYTHKIEKIIKSETVSGNLSESREVSRNLYKDISYVSESLYLMDEKAVEKALVSQKEKQLSEILSDFVAEKKIYDKTKQELNSNSQEDGEETTSVNVNEMDDAFNRETSFDYKEISFSFNTELWSGSENELSLNDSEAVAKKKLDSMFSSYVNEKKYLDSVDGGYSRDDYQPVSDLKYYAKDRKNNLVFTNFDKNETTDSVLSKRYALTIINNKANYSEAFKDVLSENTDSKTNELDFTDRNIEYYLYVDDEMQVNNGYLEGINNFYGVMEHSVKKDLIAAAILLVLSVIAAVWYLINAGTILENGKVKRAFIDYLPSDIHLLLSGAITAGLVALYVPLFKVIDSSVSGNNNHTFFLLAAALIAACIWALFIEFISSLVRVCRSEKKLWDNLALVILFKHLIIKPSVWLFKKMKSLLTYKPDNFKHRFTRFLILYAGIILILFIICAVTNNRAFDFILMMFNVGVVSFGVWYAVQLDRLITAANTRTVPKVDYNRLPQSLKYLYNSLRYTQQELETAVSKAVRDERMRSELITNVSHDLKTPLTSIITYVDLLKKCEIENDDAKEYIGVLDEKSNRLKRLIEDLIEASKITSGVINLNPVNLSLTELSAQAIGERENEFKENSLELVFTSGAQINCYADGNKTYRVIENLLSNAKKYSLKGTRVYASVYETQNYSIFEIKNTSAEPLNISPEELKERFVRGDKSRTNEGNGLGLSIADNLCRAQGGNLHITIDGDLFKAQVMLPKQK